MKIEKRKKPMPIEMDDYIILSKREYDLILKQVNILRKNSLSSIMKKIEKIKFSSDEYTQWTECNVIVEG